MQVFAAQARVGKGDSGECVSFIKDRMERLPAGGPPTKRGGVRAPVLDRAGVRIVSPRTVQMMTSGQLSFLYNGVDNFGLGFGIASELSGARGPFNAGSFYWGGFFGTTYWADPKAGLVCLIMTQENPNSHGDLAAKVEQLIYQSLR